MAYEIATGYVNLVTSGRGIGKSLTGELGDVPTQFDAAGRESGSKFAGAAKKAVAGFGALAAAGFLKGAVGLASDASESASKVGVVFGAQADQIVAASKKSATAMGLSRGAYLEAAGTLGNLLVSLDVAPQAAADMSQQMVKLAGDLASFNNVSPEEALAAIKSGLTGETEPLKRFGVNMNDATLTAQALKLGLIKTTNEALTPQTKALAAQALIMEQTKTAQGDFARTSGGLANQQRILAAQIDNAKARMGSALLPVVTMFVGVLTRDVIPAVTAFGGFLESNKTPITIVAALITALFIPALIRMGIQSTIAAAKTVASWIATQVAASGAAISSVASMVVQGAKWVWLGAVSLASAARVAAAWLISMGPIAIIVAAVIALVVVIVTNWETIKNAIVTAATFVINWVRENWPLLLAIITGPFGLAVLAIVKNWDTIKEGALAVKDWIVEKFNAIVDFITGLPGKVASAATGMWDGIKNSFKDAINWIIRGWNNLEFHIPGFDPPGPGPKFGGFDLGMPNIPELHDVGGFLQPGISLVENRTGQPEPVLNPQQWDAMFQLATAAGGGGSGGPAVWNDKVYINDGLDVDLFSRMTAGAVAARGAG